MAFSFDQASKVATHSQATEGVDSQIDYRKDIANLGAKIKERLERLNHIISQMGRDEVAIREQMRKNCLELRGEVELIEEKQRTIKEVMKNFQDAL